MLILVMFVGIYATNNIFGQSDTLDIANLTKEDVQKMQLEEILSLSLEKLVFIANKLGVSIDDLLKSKTGVSTLTDLTPRETPGIVTIITEEEIRSSGARDLIDLLRLVPGINFNYDDQGIIGIQMRGNWAFEGKVLVILDGHEINDLNYGVVPFGRHFDVNRIKKIEIIRGPGSSIYGGNAELGVINIITKSGEDINGIELTTDYSRMAHNIGQKNISLAGGYKVNNHNFSATGNILNGNRSDGSFIDSYSANHLLNNENAAIKNRNLNLAYGYKDLEIRFLNDNYFTAYPDKVDTFFYNVFQNIQGDVTYKFKLNDRLTIIPRYNYKFTRSYYSLGAPKNSVLTRNLLNLVAKYEVVKYFDLLIGGEIFYDLGRRIEDINDPYYDKWRADTANFDISAFYYKNGKKTVYYYNQAYFIQSIFKTRIANFIAGGRVDIHNQYGYATSPRIGVTKSFDYWHFKAMYSGAFRSPSVGIMQFNESIKPERTYVAEFETGLKINKYNFITLNLFHITISNPIIWYNVGNSDFGYRNYDQTGTRGIEFDYKMKYRWGFGNFNYSYYDSKEINKADIYAVKGFSNLMLGAPAHKIALHLGLKLHERFTFSPSAVYWSTNYSDVTAYAYSIFEPVMLLDCFFHYKSFLIRGLEFSFGVHDIMNKKPFFIQPYDGDISPYPSTGREWMLKLVYKLTKN